MLYIYVQCVGEDREDVEYSPKLKFEGCFKVINVQNKVKKSSCLRVLNVDSLKLKIWTGASCRWNFLDIGLPICGMWSLEFMWLTMAIILIGHFWKVEQHIMASKWVKYANFFHVTDFRSLVFQSYLIYGFKLLKIREKNAFATYLLLQQW